MKRLQATAAALVVAALSVSAVLLIRTAAAAREPQMSEKKIAPGWELPDLSGKTIRSTDFKGQVVLLDFWATWCPPCQAEIPGLVELQKKYQKQGLRVIGVSVDQASPKTVQSFAQKTGLNYPVALADEKIVAAYGGIEGLPTLFIIDGSGRIAGTHLGFAEKAQIESEIKPLLEK